MFAYIIDHFGIPYSFVVEISKWTEWMSLVILAAILIVWGLWGFLGFGGVLMISKWASLGVSLAGFYALGSLVVIFQKYKAH